MTVPDHEIHYLEIVTPDAEAAREFYGRAYGWRFGDVVPELGNAFVATLPNGSLCAIRAPLHVQEQPTVRPYVRVADVGASIRSAEAAGAAIALGPTEIPGRGTIAIYLFGGVEQGIWQVP